jgi:hypothetical protein
MSGIAAAVIGGVAAVGAGAIGALGASKAAKAQKQAAGMQAQAATDAAEAQLLANRETLAQQLLLTREQMAQQKEMYERGIGLQEPFRQAGLSAQNRLLTYLGLPGGQQGENFGLYNRNFTTQDFRADPGYAFRMSEGMKALERSAAARGGLLSGATMKGIERFGQNLASEEYANAFNRYQAERAARINPLQAMLGQGQTATGSMVGSTAEAARALGQAYGGMTNAYGTAGAQRASTYGQLGGALGQAYGNLGQAQASGYAGLANAGMGALGGLGNIANQYAQNQMMMRMFPAMSGGSPYSYGAGGYTGYGPFTG